MCRYRLAWVLGALVSALLVGAGLGHAEERRSASPPPLPLSTLEEMHRLAETLEAIKLRLEVVSPAIDDKHFKRLNTLTGYAKDFADLAVALRQDIAENRDPSADTSHTVQQLAAIELELITNPDRLHALTTLGLLSETAARRLGFFSFGAGDIAEGVGTMAGQHRLGNVDAVEKVLDGINTTAWGIYGFALTGDWEVAQAFAAASKLSAQAARNLTLPMVEQITAKISGLDQKFIAIWEGAQKVRLVHGLPVQTIEEFYHGDAAILAKLGADDLAQANARLGLASQVERRTGEHYRETCINGYCSRVDLVPPPMRNTPTQDPRGGIAIDIHLTPEDLRAR